ncbi:PREDICTED: immunoglobulin domain-containing protein oig-1-like isoform X2 [Nicrophorus vespilloides]|uniref:Immunoglobulin domain-containing protein oig-1-like isoform X2 n=1 Tax=Nicrophorus vespilloides TaxID=110193 RepID=A0ABM1NAG0_NICVS|nr:PREDICTED: immunoglobulin domain-containing protein oig-1-like isoform X2 [Nicrophorus vespilloides]
MSIGTKSRKYLFNSERRMNTKHFAIICIVIICLNATQAARGGGRGKQRARGRIYNSRMPVIIQHRNPAAASYYDNKDGAKIVKASHFELDYMLGRKITFFCMAKGYPRPEIVWFKDGIELYAHKFFQVHEWPIGNDTMKSKMEIDPTTQKDAGYYECQANNKYAIDIRGFRTDYVMVAY